MRTFHEPVNLRQCKHGVNAHDPAATNPHQTANFRAETAASFRRRISASVTCALCGAERARRHRSISALIGLHPGHLVPRMQYTPRPGLRGTAPWSRPRATPGQAPPSRCTYPGPACFPGIGLAPAWARFVFRVSFSVLQFMQQYRCDRAIHQLLSWSH
jgi:hypothetical protein